MNRISEHTAVGYLDGIRLRRALSAGIFRVISRQEYLNKINVFPVPDGDTGTNIAFTLNAILTGMSGTMERHIGRLLAVVADSALDGARGNSGAILAQFFQGFSDSAVDENAFTIESFIAAVNSGSEYARDALSEPVEGTLITVLNDFAGALLEYRSATENPDFTDLLNNGLKVAEKSLQNTPNLLPVLKKAGVVDAGAEGFVDLLRGIADFMENGSIRTMPQPEIAVQDEASDSAAMEADLSHRFCTECMVVGEDIDRRKLREELAELGSSLVLAGGKRKAKIHIHVNDPRAVFHVAEKYGTVSGQKADDMQQQSREVAHAGERGVAIISDTGADIPEEKLESLNIHLVPLRVNFGDTSYLDKVSLAADEFYRELGENPIHPTTSQPAPGDFRRQFQFLGSHYDAVVSITVTSKASGTYQAAESAANRAEGAAVKVIDSYNVAAGQGLLVMYAAECAGAGYSAMQIVDAVLAMRGKTFTFATCQNLKYAVRGGRVSKGKKLIADLLRVSPVLATKPDGKIGVGGVLFGRADRTEKFARLITRRVDPAKTYRLVVGHCDCRDRGERVLELLRESIPNLDGSWLIDGGTALGVHAGPGAIVLGLQEYQKPAEP